MKRVIYNVLIGGTSIGLTFKLAEAQQWLKESMYTGSKKIVKVAYNG